MKTRRLVFRRQCDRWGDDIFYCARLGIEFCADMTQSFFDIDNVDKFDLVLSDVRPRNPEYYALSPVFCSGERIWNVVIKDGAKESPHPIELDCYANRVFGRKKDIYVSIEVAA